MYGRKVAPDVEREPEVLAPHGALERQHRAVRPEPSAAGVALRHERALVAGPDLVEQGALHDAVADRRRRDQAELRVAHDPQGGGQRPVASRGELALKGQHLAVRVEVEARHARLARLPLRQAW